MFPSAFRWNVQASTHRRQPTGLVDQLDRRCFCNRLPPRHKLPAEQFVQLAKNIRLPGDSTNIIGCPKLDPSRRDNARLLSKADHEMGPMGFGERFSLAFERDDVRARVWYRLRRNDRLELVF